MSISVDTINLRFNVKPDYDQQQLQQLQEDLKQGQKELEKTRRAMDKLAKNGLSAMTKEQREEFDRLSASLSKTAREVHENEQKMKRWTDNVNINKLSLQQLGQRAKDLRAVLNNLNPQTDDFKEYKAELDRVNERMKELRNTADITKTSLSKFVDGFNKVSWAIQFVYQGFQKVVQWADQYVQSFAQMDEAMTDVTKYTGQTKAEVEEMNETFKQMTTRTAREELNALAGAAGRLGITARKDIEGFVSAADKINVALGDDLGEGAIDQIGKLAMVFGEDKKKGLEGAMLATGSAINVLGASSSANTGFITQFTSSMAGMAVNAKIAQTDIMGYASALSQAGIEGETASGVFAQMITKMFTDPAKFAKAARLDVKSFTDLLKTDANQAILQFLEGLKSNGGFDRLAPALKSLGMQGTQSIPVISSLINKMDELKKAQDDARQAYDEGTSIIDEFNNANSSAAAKLEISKKALNDVSVELGRKLMPIVEGGISTAATGIKVVSTLISFGSKHALTLSVLAATIGALVVAENAHVIKQKLMVLWNERVLVSSRNLWAALKANPYFAIAGLVATLAAAMYELTRNTDKAAASQRALNKIRQDAAERVGEEEAAVQTLIRASKNELLSKEDRLAAIDKLKNQIPGYVTELNRETGAYKENKEALDRYLESLSRRYEIEGAKDRLKEIGKELANLRVEQRKAQTAADNAHNVGPGYSYTTSWGSTGNTSADAIGHAEDRLDRANKAVEQKLKERQDIYDAFGVDLQKSEAKAIDPGQINPEPSPSSSIKSDSEMKKEKKERDRQRKELEAEAKQSYEEEMLRLKQQYQGRRNLQDEWHQMELSAEERYIDRLAKIRVDYGASEADKMEVANKQLDLVTKKANLLREQQQKATNQKIHQEDMRHNETLLEESQKRLNGEYADEAAFNLKMEMLEIEHQQKILEIRRAAGEDVSQEQKRLNDMLYDYRKKSQQKEISDLDTSQGEANKWLRDVEWCGQSLDMMRQLNEEYYRDGKISYQQYQQNLSDIAQAEEDKRKAIQQAAVDATNNLLSSASSLFSAMQQRETAEVDAKYKKRIAAAKKQGKDTTKLEEQQQAEKDAIAKKYAEKQFAMQVLQIIGNTAQGISKTIAELGMPWAIPFVAMAAASGAMQLASAKAAADQAAGLYEGGYNDEYQEGYTRKGDPKKQAGVIPVHQSEFVANHKAVANPEVRPVLDVIDRHQKAGDIQMLNSTRMLEEAYGSGRYRGGFTKGGSPDGGGDSQTGDTQTLGEVETLLRRIEQNTSRSMTVRSLREEIAHEERLERNARR